MEKINQYEAATLGKFIGNLLKLAHWLFIMLVVSGLLWLASLLPMLSGPFISILLELVLWACVFIASFILVGNILAYYYVLGCEMNNLERFSEQAYKKAGK
ncbi:hypothetical protein Q7Q91_15735 [Lactiplantibacillus pentosus]|uniref:hypothetical protein n=1 Tax=Lactiplantibacillus pentosus TaxID=1589 RepID=UPI0026F74838|nr:hypothetical protein [Lactiplantibacillus pentosus]MDO7806442.1 hypothetical protein [Lactiplantibacillus pentosus]